jgi:3-isopropylmalate dehydratase small subunit
MKNAFVDAHRPNFALRQERGQCVVEAFNFGCGNPLARDGLTAH